MQHRCRDLTKTSDYLHSRFLTVEFSTLSRVSHQKIAGTIPPGSKTTANRMTPGITLMTTKKIRTRLIQLRHELANNSGFSDGELRRSRLLRKDVDFSLESEKPECDDLKESRTSLLDDITQSLRTMGLSMTTRSNFYQQHQQHQQHDCNFGTMTARIVLIFAFAVQLAASGCAVNSIEFRKTVEDDNLELVEEYVSDYFDEFEVKLLPDEDFSKYQRLMITPMTVRLSEEQWQKLDDRDRNRLFTDFQHAHQVAYGDVELVNDPDSLTAIVNTYVTNLERSDPERNLVPFIIGELDLGAAVFESEVLDSTGKLIAVARGVYSGKPLIEGYSDWDVVRHASREWSKSNRALLSGMLTSMDLAKRK